MKSKLSLQDKMSAVVNNANMRKLYLHEIEIRGIRWHIGGGKINGKKVSMSTYHNAEKYAAQSVYDNFKN